MAKIRSILIVDDNDDDRILIARLFKRGLYNNPSSLTISSVASLNDARMCLSKEWFDVVTLDGNMISEYGYDLIPDIIKTQNKTTIIMISDDDHAVQTGMDLGAHIGFNKSEIIMSKLTDDFTLIPMPPKG